MSRDIALTLVGLGGGFVLSLLLWWATARLIAPRLRFSEEISKVTAARSGEPIYRIEIENIGWRKIVDLSVNARIRYPGVSYYLEPLPDNTHSIPVSSSLSNFMRLRPGKKLHVRLYSKETVENDRKREDGLHHKLFRDDETEDTLEELLTHESEPYLIVDILCFDGFSGARKDYRSHRYGTQAIKAGKFRDGKVVPFDVPTDGVA